MKKLEFDYQMKLTFSHPVTDHKFQLRCIPATGPRQQIVDVEMNLEPDTKLEKQIDSFDSVVVTGTIPEPHEVFSYHVSGHSVLWTMKIPSQNSSSHFTVLIQRLRCQALLLSIYLRYAKRALLLCLLKLHLLKLLAKSWMRSIRLLSILLVLPLSKRLPKRRLRRVRVFVRITHMLCWRYAETSDWLPLYCGHAWRRRATHAWVEIYHEGRWVGLDQRTID